MNHIWDGSLYRAEVNHVMAYIQDGVIYYIAGLRFEFEPGVLSPTAVDATCTLEQARFMGMNFMRYVMVSLERKHREAMPSAMSSDAVLLSCEGIE
jgi:hypothetical protein